MKRFSWQVSLLLPLLVLCCVEPYPLRSTDYRRQLVVEGLISGISKRHRVVLSATSLLNNYEIHPEPGASLTILHGTESIPLTETQPGIYETPVVQGITGDTYQLLITTQDGRKYSSDEVILKKSPEIKRIYGKYLTNQPSQENGIHFFLDTEDPAALTKYYRWEFEGTYEIKTPFPSSFEWLGGNNVVFRDKPIDRCWAADTSRNIVIASTAGLNEDKISALQLHYLPFYSYATRIRYSMLVRQYALSAQSFAYWKTLGDINQTQGSLFDVQPGEVRGNVKSLEDDNEAVLGYFDACTVSEKRVFFTPSDFSADGYKPIGFLTSCQNFIPEEIPASRIGEFMQRGSNAQRYHISEAVGANPATLLLLPKYCCDCTNLGTNIKPSYWP